jgi:hypothetical protein
MSSVIPNVIVFMVDLRKRFREAKSSAGRRPRVRFAMIFVSGVRKGFRIPDAAKGDHASIYHLQRWIARKRRSFFENFSSLLASAINDDDIWR